MKVLLETKNEAEITEFDEVKDALDGLVEEVKKRSDQDDDLKSRLEAIETKLARPAIVAANDNEPSEELKAFRTYLRHGSATPAEEIKTLTVSSDPQGGYLAPEEMSTEFIRELTEFSPVRSLASVRSTTAPSITYPKRTDITNAVWRGEETESTGSEPAFGQAELTAKELATHVDISNQLLADSGGSADAEVRMALAEDFGKKEATAFLNGSGALDPFGIMNDAGIGEGVSGHASEITADSLIDLIYSMPATYRNRGTFAMNGTTLAAVRKLKDTNGAYIWQPAYTAGQPETVLGRPVVEMVDLPDIAADAFPVVFGDWTGYRIVDRVALSILVNPYLLATSGLTRVHATRRVAGDVIQAAKFRKLKISAS